MEIGKEIRRRREALGYSRDILAESAGVMRSTLQRVEGGSNTTFATVEKINRALDKAEREMERDKT